jgi:hypothetical protein
MVSAFVDESADETQQRTFAIAAIIASEQEWERLEGAWQKRIQDTHGDIPFHATNCESDQEDYKQFSHSENKALYVDLVKLLAGSAAWGWGAAFDLGSYRKIFPAIDQDHCYIRAFLEVINFFADFSKKKYNDTVKFTFDTREQSNYSAGKIYNLMATDPANSYLFDEISFASSRKTPRLQMADMFAFEVMKELDNRIRPVTRPRRKSLLALNAEGKFGCDLFLKEFFEDMKVNLFKMETKDPAFTREAYAAWLQRFERTDTPRNRFNFLIWFSEQERRKG